MLLTSGMSLTPPYTGNKDQLFDFYWEVRLSMYEAWKVCSAVVENLQPNRRGFQCFQHLNRR